MEYQRVCPICELVFTADRHNTVYCCDECRRRAIRDREQAKRRRRRNMTHDQKDDHLSVAEVYRRANGICSVCGLPVPLLCDRNDAWSRTKDHIIPLEQGGSHSYDNCQLAHRVCNSVKRQHGAGFRICWEDRLAADPERWGRRLSRLNALLAVDAHVGAGALR